MNGFVLRNLGVLAYAAGFTQWVYKASALAEVERGGFFNDVADMLTTGDMIMVHAPDGGSVLFVQIEDGVVTTLPMCSAVVPK